MSDQLTCGLCGFKLKEGDVLVLQDVGDDVEPMIVHEACRLKDEIQILTHFLDCDDDQINELNDSKVKLTEQLLKLTSRLQEQAEELKEVKKDRDDLLIKLIKEESPVKTECQCECSVIEDGLVH